MGTALAIDRDRYTLGSSARTALIVHDEAHLEPAFQALLDAMEAEQRRCGDFRPTRVMELTATPRGDNQPFRLTDREKSPPEELPHELSEPLHFAWQRLKAKKGIAFHRPDGEKEKVADRIAMLAKKYADDESGKAILVYVSSLEDHATVCKALHGQNVQMLTGTLRGLERDRMANPRRETGCPIFARFLKPPKPEAGENERWKVTPKPGTVYLVCTSAGEVGIDISADHLVCDLAAFDRMAQRFGRVNRFGTGDAKIDVVHESTPDPKKENDPNDQARWRTLELLKELPLVGTRRSASPLALMELRGRAELKPKFDLAYTPKPVILPATDILFDSWALTSVTGKLPGRPPVEPYLHGVPDRETPETYVAWREEVGVIKGELLKRYKPEELLEDYPLKPHELLRDRSDRVLKHLGALAERRPDAPIWLLDESGTVEPLTLGYLAEKGRKDQINYRTVLLSPDIGGLLIEDRESRGNAEWLFKGGGGAPKLLRRVGRMA